jgi:alpha-L-rhamnosidase
MSDIRIASVACEYRRNPLGLDTPAPRFSWILESAKRAAKQSAYRLQVAEEETFEGPLVWDTGKVVSDDSVHIVYEGPALRSRTRYFYRVRVWDQAGSESDWSETAYWETAILDPAEFRASWITADPESSDADGSGGKKAPGPCRYMRRTFSADAGVKRARIYATALGLYELHLNGSRASDLLLAPGWTSYNHRLQYQTYDVTGLIRNGPNAIGVVLGDGWYRGRLTWFHHRDVFGARRAAFLQLHIEYEDGREQIVVTDSSWKTTDAGPIRMSDIYDGEIYDARMELGDWSSPGFDDAGWESVQVMDAPQARLVAQEVEPVRIVETIEPIALLKTPSGQTALDMGQNMVGFVRFRIKAPAGTAVTLRHAEVLDKNGNVYTGNLRSAKQTVTYICKGGEEVYEPHFTFQGFRYVILEGFPEEPKLEQFTGCVIHSDMQPTGSFECSEPMLNQLQRNILWGMKGNFVDVPTDCPQRDERLGWTGDAQVFIRTAAFLMNVAPFFTKWLRDLRADQLESGGVPAVIPYVKGVDSHSSSAWGDAATICPWTIYQCYGDTRLLEEQYESMKAWVEYIRAQGEDELLWNTGHHYGDWLALDAAENSYTGSTPKDLIATAFFAYSAALVAKAAAVLNRGDDAKAYEELHQRVVQRFREEFVTPNGRLVSPTQTAHVLALKFNLVEEKHRPRIIRTLARLIEERNVHLTTGFVGTPYLCPVLSDAGLHDLAYQLVLQKDYPSWLYPITKGATTIWEHWDGIKPDGSFWSDNMNSFNHYAYGSIGEWLYRYAAGLDSYESQPGYKRLRIRPMPHRSLRYARAKLATMYGVAASGWQLSEDGRRIAIEAAVPANTTASVLLPRAALADVTESGAPLASVQGVLEARQTDEGVRLELGSGSYAFEYSWNG